MNSESFFFVLKQGRLNLVEFIKRRYIKESQNLYPELNLLFVGDFISVGIREHCGILEGRMGFK